MQNAVAEARRFIARAESLMNADPSRDYFYSNPKEAGAARRASMDLTRALSEMRKPQQ